MLAIDAIIVAKDALVVATERMFCKPFSFLSF
jgi:hypothetical protein